MTGRRAPCREIEIVKNSLPLKERLVDLFIKYPLTAFSVEQISVQLGRDFKLEYIQHELSLFVTKRFIQEIKYEEGNRYRYIPR